MDIIFIHRIFRKKKYKMDFVIVITFVEMIYLQSVMMRMFNALHRISVKRLI